MPVNGTSPTPSYQNDCLGPYYQSPGNGVEIPKPPLVSQGPDPYSGVCTAGDGMDATNVHGDGADVEPQNRSQYSGKDPGAYSCVADDQVVDAARVRAREMACPEATTFVKDDCLEANPESDEYCEAQQRHATERCVDDGLPNMTRGETVKDSSEKCEIEAEEPAFEECMEIREGRSQAICEGDSPRLQNGQSVDDPEECMELRREGTNKTIDRRGAAEGTSEATAHGVADNGNLGVEVGPPGGWWKVKGGGGRTVTDTTTHGRSHTDSRLLGVEYAPNKGDRATCTQQAQEAHTQCMLNQRM